MSGENMDDVPLSDVTGRQPYVSKRSADSNDAQVQNASTRGKSRSVNKIAMSSILLCHVILVAFTVYIIVLCFLDSYKLFLWHPALMTIGCFLLMAEAVLAMSPDSPFTGKFGRSSRVQLHWILQALAALLTYIGFLIIVINKNKNNALHFQTWHATFGLIAVIMVGITSCGGVSALYSIKFKKLLRPAFLKLIHNSAGILTIIFSTISMIFSLYSGWYIHQKSYSDTVKYICFVLICISTFITLQNAARSTFSRIIQMCQRQ